MKLRKATFEVIEGENAYHVVWLCDKDGQPREVLINALSGEPFYVPPGAWNKWRPTPDNAQRLLRRVLERASVPQ